METTTINLFAATKVKEPAKKVSAKKQFKVTLLDNKIAKFSDLKNQIESATSELKMIEADIKTVGKDLFLKEYKAGKLRPESFKIEDASGASCMFICMDKYTIVDENKAEILQQFDNLLDERLTYKINPDLVEKYAAVLSGLIVNCPDISDEDKTQLIQGEKQYGIVKGALDRLLQYDAPEQIFELINPIVALKK